MNGYQIVSEAILSKVVANDPLFGEIRQSRLKKNWFFCDYPASKLRYNDQKITITFIAIPSETTRKNFSVVEKQWKQIIKQIFTLSNRDIQKYSGKDGYEDLKKDVQDIIQSPPDSMHISKIDGSELEITFHGDWSGGRIEAIVKRGRVVKAYWTNA